MVFHNWFVEINSNFGWFCIRSQPHASSHSQLVVDVRTTLIAWTIIQIIFVHLYKVLLKMNMNRSIAIVGIRAHVQTVPDKDDATIEIVHIVLVDFSHDAGFLGIFLAWISFR